MSKAALLSAFVIAFVKLAGPAEAHTPCGLREAISRILQQRTQQEAKAATPWDVCVSELLASQSGHDPAMPGHPNAPAYAAAP